MAHEVETMAYANATPWHGLGNKVHTEIGVDEMLVEAGLDWTVSQHPLYADFNGERIPTNKFALVRDTDKKVLTVTGERWKPLQNHDAMELFREYTERGGATLETAGSLKGGKVVWALANIKSGFKLPDGDETEGFLLLTSPHEVGKSITVQTTAVRVVCANTMAIALNGETKSRYRQTHASVFDMAAAKEVVEMSRDAMQVAGQEAALLQKTAFDPTDAMQFFHKLVSGEELERAEAKMLLEEEQAKGTLKKLVDSYYNGRGANQKNAWGAMNAVTFWADHVAGRSQDTRLANAWFGNTARIKQEARQTLLEMAA